MFLRMAHRVLSISLATVLTLGMLVGVDSLSQPDTTVAHVVQPGSHGQA